jgi:hypothetical protein
MLITSEIDRPGGAAAEQTLDAVSGYHGANGNVKRHRCPLHRTPAAGTNFHLEDGNHGAGTVGRREVRR